MKRKLLFLSTIVAALFNVSASYAYQGDTEYQEYSEKQSEQTDQTNTNQCTPDPNMQGGNTCTNNPQSNLNTTNTVNGGNGAAAPKPLQNSSTEQVAGTIRTINRIQLPNETQVQLILTTNQGDILVIVGPESFLQQSKIGFQPGDKITVTGFKVSANGHEAMIAAQIQKNGATLQLLNENRMPLWMQNQGMQQQGYGNPYSGRQNFNKPYSH
jgi:hypothetical protein